MAIYSLNPNDYLYGDFFADNEESGNNFLALYKEIERQIDLWPTRKDLWNTAEQFFTLGVLYGEAGLKMSRYLKSTAIRGER